MENVIIPKSEYLKMKREIKTLRNSDLYKKIIKSKEELKKKVYTRKDLGF
jgi:PHD/YefM family antitoxin component YafN of YafNO toxin-antitoxin module